MNVFLQKAVEVTQHWTASKQISKLIEIFPNLERHVIEEAVKLNSQKILNNAQITQSDKHE